MQIISKKMSACLLCLKTKRKQIQFCSQKGEDLRCSFIIGKYFWFPLNELKDSKKSVCQICWNKVEEFHQFYQQISEAHNRLEFEDVIILNDAAEEALDNASTILAKTGENNQLNFNADLFNAEIKIETNEIENLPAIEIIENIPDENIPLETKFVFEQTPNKLLKQDSLNSSDNDSETGMRLSILQQSPTDKMLKTSFENEKETISLTIEEINVKDMKLQPEEHVSNENITDNEECDFNVESDHDETTKECTKRTKKTRPNKIQEKENYNESIAKFYAKLQCAKCELTVLNFDTLRQHFRKSHKNLVPSAECCGRKFYLRRKLSEHAFLHLHPEYLKCCFTSCDQVFPDQTQLHEHENSHKKVTVKSEIVQCDKCPKTFASKKNLNEHQAVHISKSDYKFPCTVCGAKFATKRRARHHMKDIHSRGRSLTCDTCGKEARNYKSLREHKIIHKKAPLQISNPIQCDICEKFLIHGETLRQHKNWVHTNNVVSQDNNDENLAQLPKVLDCAKCQKTFTSKQSLNEHQAVHISKSDYKFPCPICGVKFATKRRAHHHMKDIHSMGRSLICETCGKQARNRKALRMHKVKHLETPVPVSDPIQCDICGKWLKHGDTLRQHKTWVHKKNIEQQCHICDKISPNLRALERHITRTHQTELKFKCTMCTKTYRTLRELRDHTNVHTREVLYKCEMCTKSFSRKSSLEKHKKNFHSENPVKLERAQCEICNVWVNSSYYLKEHMLKMHERSNIECRCQICGKISVNENALKRHIKRNHKLDDDPMSAFEITSIEIDNAKMEVHHEILINSEVVEME